VRVLQRENITAYTYIMYTDITLYGYGHKQY